MNNFKEWLSDYLRYFMLGLALLLVVGLALIGFKVYQSQRVRDDGNVIEILSEKETQGGETESETETAAEKNTESETAAVTERNTESETDAGEGQRESAGGTSNAGNQSGVSDGENQSGESGVISTGEGSGQESAEGGRTLAASGEEGGQRTEQTEQTERETEPPAEEEYVPVYLTMQGACYIRSGPGYEYDIIGEYSAGTVVEFLEDAGGWYKVQIDGMVGYMGARFF